MSFHAWSARISSRVGVAHRHGRGAGSFQPRLERLESRLVPSFSAPFLYTAGPFPRSVAVGDFNGDGYPDIVTANDGTGNSISVLLNNGDGTFRAPLNYPAGNQPVQVVVGDFNRDGNLDLAVANLSSNNVSVFLGNGDGTFRAGATVPVGTGPRSLAVGDFNGDGIPDLVVACTDGYQTHGAYVLLGNGDGTFRLSEHDPADTPISVTVGDFNGDGKLDFATADAGYQVSRYQGRGDGTFLPYVNYPAGHRVAQIANADFNNDGKLDLITSGDTYGTFAILPGVGNGTFQSPISSNDFVGSAWVQPGDFNRDGKLDVATLRDDGDNVWVRLGNGDFTFQAYDQYPVGPGPGAHATSLAVADVNGDGYPDIIVADRSFDYVAVLINHPAADHFGVSAPAASIAGMPFNVTVSALNPLGQTDPGYRGRVHFTSSDAQASLPGDYTFTAADMGVHTFSVTLKTAGNQTVTATDTTSASFMGSATVAVTPAAVSRLAVAGFPSPVTAGTVHTFEVAAKDAYGNTVPDYTGTVHFTSSDPRAIVPEDYTFTAADGGRQVFGAVLRTAGTQSLSATDVVDSSITGTQSGIAVNPAAADHLALDAPPTVSDGTPFPLTVTAKDLFDNTATGYRGTVHFTTSDPQATLPADYPFSAGDAGVHTFTVTLRAVGNQTVMVSDAANDTINGSTTVLVNPVLFYPAVNYTTLATPRSVVTGDFNGDGIPDLVATGRPLSLFLGNGDGTFQTARTINSPYNSHEVVAGDFNGDGILDLATANWTSNNSVSIFLGNGDGTFQDPLTFAAGNLPTGLALGDWNGDGKLDLAVTNHYARSVTVYLGNGDGTLREVATYTVGDFPITVRTGDFNGDGKPDLVVVNSGPGFPEDDTVTILLGNGDGTFRSGGNYVVGSHPFSAVVADLNGDGVLDIATANEVGNTMGVLLGNGDGSFHPVVQYPDGPDPLWIEAADFNRDGKVDLVTANSLGNALHVFLGNGDGTFGAFQSFAAGTQPNSVAVGDFNGDGFPDLVVTSGTTNNVWVLLNAAEGPALTGGGPGQGNQREFVLPTVGDSRLSEPNWQASPSARVTAKGGARTADLIVAPTSLVGVSPVPALNGGNELSLGDLILLGMMLEDLWKPA